MWPVSSRLRSLLISLLRMSKYLSSFSQRALCRSSASSSSDRCAPISVRAHFARHVSSSARVFARSLSVLMSIFSIPCTLPPLYRPRPQQVQLLKKRIAGRKRRQIMAVEDQSQQRLVGTPWEDHVLGYAFQHLAILLGRRWLRPLADSPPPFFQPALMFSWVAHSTCHDFIAQ